MQPGAVGEAHVDGWRRVVDPSSGAGDDPGQQGPDLLIRGEARVELLLGASRADDEPAIGSVHDHLLDRLVVEERLERTEAEELVEELLSGRGALLRRERRVVRKDAAAVLLLDEIDEQRPGADLGVILRQVVGEGAPDLLLCPLPGGPSTVSCTGVMRSPPRARAPASRVRR